jgi:glycosyltransferase involved in cell wall biosynthesis
MRLALMLDAPALGGAQRRVLALAGALADRGAEVELWFARARGPLAGEIPAGVDVAEVGGPAARAPVIRSVRDLRMSAAVPEIARRLRRTRPDALVAGANHAAFAAIAAHRLAGVPGTALVLRASNALAAGRSGPAAALRLAAVRALYPAADAVVAVSRALADELRALLPGAADRVAVVPNPVVGPELAALARAPAPGFPETVGMPVVLGVGRFVPHKGFPTLVEAAAIAARRRPLRLVLLGDGPDRGRIEAAARRHGLAERLILAGTVANPFAWMARADLVALASSHEGLPGVLVEAMACGCPVAATDTPGAREALLDGALGPLVPVGDAPGLAESILAALDAPRDRERLTARAADYRVDAAADAWLGVIARAAERARSADGARRRPGTPPP